MLFLIDHGGPIAADERSAADRGQAKADALEKTYKAEQAKLEEQVAAPEPSSEA